jgi:preflagellin peptidase FlaK
VDATDPADPAVGVDGGGREASGADPPTAGGDDPADPWAAARFLEGIEGSAYGTTPATLRAGLETVVARDRVWLSPGLPFVVPMFVGLVVAFTFGDLLFAVLRLVGLA